MRDAWESIGRGGTCESSNSSRKPLQSRSIALNMANASARGLSSVIVSARPPFAYLAYFQNTIIEGRVSVVEGTRTANMTEEATVIERILHDCATIENLLEIDPQPSAAEWQAFTAHALASPTPQCANALGSCYYCGVGVAENSEEAAKCFGLAAEQGLAVAQCKLGWCYEIGEGVSTDLTEAVRLYQLAADQGHPRAEFNLGMCYNKGEGVAADPQEAVRLFRLSAEHGHPDAERVLRRLEAS